MAQPISPKTPVVHEQVAKKTVYTNQMFTVVTIASALNKAPGGVQFVDCTLLCGKSVVPIDQDGRISPVSTK